MSSIATANNVTALPSTPEIDNSVVVLENIFRHMEEGESPVEAAAAELQRSHRSQCAAADRTSSRQDTPKP